MQKSTVKHYHNNFDCCYFLFVSLIVWAFVCCCSEACPEGCNCDSNQNWKCANLNTLGDIWKNSTRAVQELTLSNVTDLNSYSDHFGASFESVQRLRIQKSSISRVSALFIDSFPKVEKVFLEDNQFSCSEHILALQTWESKIPTPTDKLLLCSSPDGMAGTELFEALKIIARVKEECPTSCRCWLKSMKSQYSVPNLFVNCSQSNLKVIPDSLPKSGVIELDLSHNQVSRLPFFHSYVKVLIDLLLLFVRLKMLVLCSVFHSIKMCQYLILPTITSKILMCQMMPDTRIISDS
jgi:hypothetical protein